MMIAVGMVVVAQLVLSPPHSPHASARSCTISTLPSGSCVEFVHALNGASRPYASPRGGVLPPLATTTAVEVLVVRDVVGSAAQSDRKGDEGVTKNA